MRILVVNSGSSSLKLRLVDGRDSVAGRADLPPVDLAGDAAIGSAIRGLGPFEAVGHRIVHGGLTYGAPVLIDSAVRRELERLSSMAPLHQPPAVRAVDIVAAASDVPAVACFDTAFHAGMPAAASTYAVPRSWREDLGVRKYGFHGLAHAWTSRRASEMLGEQGPSARLVTCHLGAGASLAAVVGGRGADTTMGFTPLDGLVMATRSGAVDPAVVLWLQNHAGMHPHEIGDALEHRSGLAAMAGTPDMRVVLDRSSRGDDDASLAVEVYLHRLRTGIGSMAAAAGGIDALVYSGGIGEHAPEVRERVATGLEFLGITVDPQRNRAAVPDTEITGTGPVRVFVIAAREDLEIARAVGATLSAETG
ncbi:MAG: acetate/propionate family kinase [Actinobacteria bacterium]|nr:acetate/propionate family kinase [Actinomycetota bacterium]